MQQYAILLGKSKDRLNSSLREKGEKKGNKKFLNVHNFHKNIKLIDDELK